MTLLPFIELVASTAHEVNRVYCQYHGDESQPAWEDAPDWQKRSAMNGVVFHMQNPDASPSASHESWLAEKIADGWVYGKEKDPVKKTHPCVQPFDFLPIEQKYKDILFASVVKGFLANKDNIGV